MEFINKNCLNIGRVISGYGLKKLSRFQMHFYKKTNMVLKNLLFLKT